jgi:hypothetical protein
MSRQQRQALDALLRSAPRSETPPTPAQQRTSFATAVTRPAPDGVSTRRTVLGGPERQTAAGCCTSTAAATS